MDREERDAHIEEMEQLEEEMREEALSIEKVETMEVLLSTGGPASKIVFTKDGNASYQYQDWFKPWQKAELTRQQQIILDDYVEQNFLWMFDDIR